MKLIPKPEGHDLRNARAEKSESARDWLPDDALFAAQEHMKKHPVHGAMIVAWYTLSENGLPYVKYCLSNKECRMGTALVADTLFEMQCATREM
jgi:hypothetical protein